MKRDAEAKTTVVIPVWDKYANVLAQAVESLVRQEREFDLVIVDNASSVAIPAISGAVLVRAPARLSLGEARNLALARVHTPYVVFWDADDEMLPGTLGQLEDAIDADERFVAFGMAIRESPSGKRHRWPRRWIGRLIRYPSLLAVLDCVWSAFPTTGSTIIRTVPARAGGGFADADSGEDWCLGVSLAFRGRIGWCERHGRVYRLYGDSMWAQHMTAKHQLHHAAAVRRRLREDPAVPPWIKRSIGAIWVAQYLAIGAHAGVALLSRRPRLSG